MNVIVNGKTYEGTTLRTGENGNLFLDDQDLGELDNQEFRGRTIKGKVCLSQLNVVQGGLNV